MAFALAVSPATAQSGSDPASQAPVHLGPFALTPSIALTNFGVDSNVFNDLDKPKRAFTATLTPQTAAQLWLGPTRFTANGAVDVVYFSQYANQRSLNLHDDVRIELPLSGVVPYIAISSVNTKQRPGNEIDARARHSVNTMTVGGNIRIGGKTTIDVAAVTSHTNFAQGATFGGVDLREALKNDIRGNTTSIRYAVTPLTQVVLQAETERDRFEFSPIRNTDSFRVMPGVEFDPVALITGAAHVGFRKFNLLDPAVPDFAGAVADVELGYTLLSATQFTVQTSRDLAYSYEATQPYYVATGISGTVARHVAGPWEVIGSIGRQRLNYQSIRGVTPSLPNTGRGDVVSNYGAALGYRIDPSRRLEFKLEHYRRHSSAASLHDYDGFRFGTSVTYGLR